MWYDMMWCDMIWYDIDDDDGDDDDDDDDDDGCFHKWGTPNMDGLQWKVVLKWMI